MKFIIEETKEEVELKIIDPRTGVEYTADYMDIGTNDAVSIDTDDCGMVTYIINKDDFEWWKEVIENQEYLDSLIAESSLSQDEIMDLFEEEGCNHNDIDTAIKLKIDYLESQND